VTSHTEDIQRGEKEKSEEEILRAKICHCLPGHGF
jgi:hypothetical protein